ncbi:MAG: hypothetical protein C5B60_02550 [Chloroflexi bacterium]|nr:MAG: hypothetical protein C5B60_02550 [Chloroflexota bacterium]
MARPLASWRGAINTSMCGSACARISRVPTMRMTPEQAAWFERVHTEWFEVMRPFDDGFQISPLFPPLPVLLPERLVGCELLSSREEILRRLPKGSVGAEIGTQEGRFAEKIMEIARPEQLYLFDLHDTWLIPRQPILQAAAEKIGTDVFFDRGDSSINLAKYPDDRFDWIYIDGDHSYEGVRRDIEVARIKIKPNGLLIFNDFTIWSVAECCDYGVPYAVCEFIEQYGWNMVYFALHPHCYHDVALRRPA